MLIIRGIIMHTTVIEECCVGGCLMLVDMVAVDMNGSQASVLPLVVMNCLTVFWDEVEVTIVRFTVFSVLWNAFCVRCTTTWPFWVGGNGICISSLTDSADTITSGDKLEGASSANCFAKLPTYIIMLFLSGLFCVTSIKKICGLSYLGILYSRYHIPENNVSST